MAVGIPTVAIELARRLHGYDVVAQYGVLFNPLVSEIPDSFADPYLLDWAAEARVPVETCLDMFRRGVVTVGFVSGAQVDVNGNVNSVCIGPHDRPKVRLTGAIAQTDHAAAAGRTIIVLEQARRSLVEHVDFISAVGQIEAPGGRKALGLRGGGPAKVVTDRAVFGFPDGSARLALQSIHPGWSFQQVCAETEFQLDPNSDIATTEPPTNEELVCIRTEIDPTGKLLGGRIL